MSLSDSELASLLDDEDYKAQKAIDKQREEDEKAVCTKSIESVLWLHMSIHMITKFEGINHLPLETILWVVVLLYCTAYRSL